MQASVKALEQVVRRVAQESLVDTEVGAKRLFQCGDAYRDANSYKVPEPVLLPRLRVNAGGHELGLAFLGPQQIPTAWVDNGIKGVSTANHELQTDISNQSCQVVVERQESKLLKFALSLVRPSILPDVPVRVLCMEHSVVRPPRTSLLLVEAAMLGAAVAGREWNHRTAA